MEEILAVSLADAADNSGERQGDHRGSLTGDKVCGFPISVPFLQKIVAEVLGTYFIIFAGCASVTVNHSKGMVTFPGICIVWGLVVMVMVYSLGHISGAHFNPAVTIAFATCRRFPWSQVPVYIAAQVLGSTLASGTLRLLFGPEQLFHGTIPQGSDVQSLVLEFIITFYLMFVISGVATDNRAVSGSNRAPSMFDLGRSPLPIDPFIFSADAVLACPTFPPHDVTPLKTPTLSVWTILIRGKLQIGELAGLAVGATVLINVLFAGPISGASMNPARTLGPAIVANRYEGIWVYMVGTVCGAVAGAWTYNLIRFTDKSLCEVTKSGSCLRSLVHKTSGAR
ncbi:hypothetical protein Taro_030958 [Colocasia esculenta]|uniref:Uncharacterized protein n=1 Tax=Colocasia esculenta TaxID=4460 RepID=A0A843VVF0_COLES|nr:hypothetical protein [Colocasia esculenta]